MAPYYTANTVDTDAVNRKASWTKDELGDLRDFWRLMDLREIAVHLGRTERACESQYYYQLSRPKAERWQPPQRHQRAMTGEERGWRSPRADGPVNTIHDDEDRWWDGPWMKEKGYYKDAG